MFRNQPFNVLSFLIIFAVLYYSFVLYIGIISPGGKGYSPFLDHYFNIPAWLTYGICSAAKFLLQLAGFDAYQKAPNNVSIRGSNGVNIIWACLGVGVMCFWTAFAAAHKAQWVYKAKWIIGGIIFIIVLNIIRIVSIPLAFYYHWNVYTNFDLHLMFNIVCYCAIFLLMFLFIKNFNRHYRKADKP